MENVIKYLEALTSGIGKQDEEITMNFYHISLSQLDTAEEKEAFKQGSLAVFAEAGKMRFRRMWYTRKYKKALKQLQ